MDHFQRHGLTHQLGPSRAARPLVVLHERHLNNIHSLKRQEQVAKPSGILFVLKLQITHNWSDNGLWRLCGWLVGGLTKILVEDWKARRLLYTTPRGMNDDWFWLYAGVASTQGDRRHSIVVSNDQMRCDAIKMQQL